jgi:hypothetical protein
MAIKIVYLPLAAQIEKSVAEAVGILTAKLECADETLTATEIMPLAQGVLDLSELGGKVEAATVLFNHRIEAYEAALSAGATKPSSDFATKLDLRLTATSDLLRATLDRLDQIETAVIRLYQPPFIAIDEHDKPRKALMDLKASFDLACAKP